MEISIAMATYNSEKYVLEQLESFTNQTVLPDELVITDDCSTDNTLEIVNIFKKTASFEVRVYSNEKNLGYTQNFNKAMQLCTNDLIFLSDQDDVWFPTKIEYMLNLTVQYPDKDLFMIDAELTDINLKKSGLTKQGQIRGLGLDKSAFVMGCCIVVKKSYLDLILPIPKGFSGHDDWIVNIADMLNLRYIDSSIQQYYRIHGNNTSTFIANRLVKTEKQKITFKEKFINRIKYSKILSFNNLIDKQSHYIVSLKRLSKEQHYHLIADRALENIKKDIELLDNRLLVIRSKNIFDRIYKGLKLYLNGNYSSNYGLKNCLSDFIFS